jgi:hypothetical protein
LETFSSNVVLKTPLFDLSKLIRKNIRKIFRCNVKNTAIKMFTVLFRRNADL